MTTENPDEPVTPKLEPVDQTPPSWAVELKRTIEALPGKLTATLTDDDRNSIAEQVHNLFDRSGAFQTGSEPDPTEPDPTEPDPTEKETPPKKAGLSRFASWFAGDETA